MRIATRLKISSAVTFATIVLLAPLLFWALNKFDTTQVDNNFVDQLKEVATIDQVIGDQYFLYREDRLLNRRKENQIAYDELLAQSGLHIRNKSTEDAFLRVKSLHDESNVIFTRLVNHIGLLKSKFVDKQIASEFDKRLYSQLLLKRSAINDTLDEVSKHYTKLSQQAYFYLISIVGAFALILATITLFTSSQIRSLIDRRLSPLHQGAQIVAGGDLNHRINADGQDEFSELAASINAMTQSLQNFTRQLGDEIKVHKQLEEALGKSSHDMQRLLDSMAEGAYGVDTKEICTFVNPSFLNILGYSNANQVLGKHMHSLIHHSRVDGSVYPVTECKLYQAYIDQKNVHVDDEVFWRADGIAIPVEYWSSPIIENGCMTGAIVTFNDITERKRIDDMKSEFVSTVSHELRTPLTAITGALGLIAGGAVGELQSQAKVMIDVALRNSQRLTHLINDLLDMEKLVAGKMHFDMQQQPLLPLIEQAIEINLSLGTQHRIKLVLTHANAESLVVVDNRRLMQVLSNLLSNAIKYSPADGTVEIAMHTQKNSVRITITDKGPGIPAAFHNRIFQKFSQADSSDTRQKGGTGLGLAISRELIDRMEGQIGFNSIEGQGACFFIELPLA